MLDIFNFNTQGKDGEEDTADDTVTNYILSTRTFIIESRHNFAANYDCETKRVEHIDDILKKLVDLYSNAQKKSITKHTYKDLKKELLDLLGEYFGCHEDIQRLEETVCFLEKHQILPPNSYEAFLTLTPLGRWY